jgi:hypothetical protein
MALDKHQTGTPQDLDRFLVEDLATQSIEYPLHEAMTLKYVSAAQTTTPSRHLTAAAMHKLHADCKWLHEQV